jgi:hypothetical protein
LRENEVWVGSKVNAHDWFEKGGAIALMCDVLVALGWLWKERQKES